MSWIFHQNSVYWRDWLSIGHYGTAHLPASSRAHFTSLSQPKDRSFSCDL